MRIIIWIAATAMLALGGRAGAAQAPFSVEDYAKLRRVTELALSSNGEFVAYAVEGPGENGAGTARTVIVQGATPDAPPLDIPIPATAARFAWIPESEDLAYIASSGGGRQIFAVNARSGRTRRLTKEAGSVLSFKFSGDGTKIAWAAREETPDAARGSSLYDRLHGGETGVVVDYMRAGLYHFVDPGLPDGSAPGRVFLRVRDRGGPPIIVEAARAVKGYHWSASGDRLSILYGAEEASDDPFANILTSIGVYDLRSDRLSVIFEAVPFSEEAEPIYYLGGEWAPGDKALFVRRVRHEGYWRSRREWALIPVDERRGEENWAEYRLYPASAEITLLTTGAALAGGMVDGRRGLFEIAREGAPQWRALGDVRGDISSAEVSVDGETAVFVNESLTRPPEIYVLRQGEISRLTDLNASISARAMPNAREVFWRGAKGVRSQGWLLTPPDASAGQPMPLLTFLHGGPSMPMTDAFAQYFTFYGGVWPYPLEALAMNGVAVFIPNYHGTESFGNDYANPARSDGEALDDVISGIDALIAQGVADPARIAVSGHSHGAWLGSLALTRKKDAVAAIFSEGPQNNILTYIFSPASLYENGYHKLWGASLYDAPGRYLETSPVFNFEGINAATLFEAGARSQAISMMGSPKAAWLAGMPAEFVVYPKTGHNIRDQKLKVESADRILDWSLFWLLGREDPASSKAAQYERWRRMRAEACARRKTAPPSYCE